jgi:hypothetical protein
MRKPPLNRGFPEWAIEDSNLWPLPCEDTFALGQGFIGWVIKGHQRTLFAQVSATFWIVVEVLR